MTAPAARARDERIWHDVEAGGYSADLELWRSLAEKAGGPILDLGCGTGRVATELARAGFDVTGVDCEPTLVAALAARARARGLRVTTAVGDVRALALGRRFALAIAPMQVVQLLGGPPGRARMLACVREHLRRGGVLAAALADPFEAVPAAEALPPLPDLREEDGWVYQSTPVAVRVDADATVVERVRQVVSPTGELAESRATLRLDGLAPDELERAAREAGLEPLARRHVGPTPDHVGSTIVMAVRR